MQAINKRIVAREWLFLLGALFVGVIAIPVILVVIFSNSDVGAGLQRYFGSFFDGSLFDGRRGAIIGWGFILGPYMVFQLIRSIVWAVRVVRS